MVIDNGCVGFDTLYGALAQVEIPLCPEYGDTTVAVLRSDGSIKVSHLIANYNAALVQASSKFNMYVQGESTPTELSANVSAEGLMTVVLPDSIVSTLVGKILTFTPVLSLLNGCDNYLSAAPTAEICVPLPADMKPSFSGVTNTDGLGKMNLFPNNGVIVKAKILNYDSAFTKKTGFLISREAITAYNPDLYQEVAVVPSGETGDSIVYTVGIDSCGGFTHYCPFVILDCCDSVVLGTDHSFEMWAPSLDTVSADPYTIAANGTVMLKAVATMEVASWPTVAGSYTAFMPYAAGMCSSMTECVDDTSCAVYCSNLPNASDAVLQPMENWMTLLVAVRNCCVTWSMVKTSIMNSFGIDPADAIFKYVWEANGSEIYQSGTSGTTYVQPATTTNYTAKAIFTYNNTSCVVKDTVTVTVNP